MYLADALTRELLAAISRQFGGVSGSALSHIVRAVVAQLGEAGPSKGR